MNLNAKYDNRFDFFVKATGRYIHDCLNRENGLNRIMLLATPFAVGLNFIFPFERKKNDPLAAEYR
jgi:hypothetical protein